MGAWKWQTQDAIQEEATIFLIVIIRQKHRKNEQRTNRLIEPTKRETHPKKKKNEQKFWKSWKNPQNTQKMSKSSFWPLQIRKSLETETLDSENCPKSSKCKTQTKSFLTRVSELFKTAPPDSVILYRASMKGHFLSCQAQGQHFSPKIAEIEVLDLKTGPMNPYTKSTWTTQKEFEGQKVSKRNALSLILKKGSKNAPRGDFGEIV